MRSLFIVVVCLMAGCSNPVDPDPRMTCEDICVYFGETCAPICVDQTACITDCRANPRVTPEWNDRFQVCVDCFTTTGECQKQNAEVLCYDECLGVF